MQNRDEAQSITSYLQEQMGPRRPGSAAEATAAAYINARLRQVGAHVGTQALDIAARPQHIFTIIFALAFLGAVVAPFLPLAGILLALWAVGALLADRLIAPLPAPGPRLVSQNVFGMRAISADFPGAVRTPRWRVVILARLDTPPAPAGLRRLFAPTRSGALARLAGPALALAAAIAALALPALAWPIAAGAAAYLALLVGASLLPPIDPAPGPATPGLAALVATMARLTNLQQVELWTVALGAAANGDTSVRTLLHSFPFDPATTLVIGIEDLAGAHLAYATREGALFGRPTDPLLLRLADAADAADTTIDAEPRPFTYDDALTAGFRRRAFRTLTIFTAPGAAQPPAASHLLTEQAVRLTTGIVEQLEREAT